MNSEKENYMRRCIELALLGAGSTRANPMVGSVLVYENRVIGEGYHRAYGGPHAEVNCLNAVLPEERIHIPDSTIYVTLEPCAHFGKTPPCADLLVASGIKKVVIGCRDPFPEVNGKGIEKLRAAGVEVETGVLEAACRYLNRRFFTFHELNRPYIVLKWAETADGFIGNYGSRLLISNAISQRLVHRWRSEEMSIMVGTNTAMNDDPQLTARYWSGVDPVRIVPDRTLRLPQKLQIFDGHAPTIILNAIRQDTSGNPGYVLIEENTKQALQDNLPVMPDENDISPLLAAIASRNLNSVLVEGGLKLLQAFINAGYWDEARVIRNRNLYLGHGIAAPLLPGARLYDSMILQNDEVLYLDNPLNTYTTSIREHHERS